MEVQRLFAVALRQALRAVSPVETEQASGVEQQHWPTQQAGRVQGFPAQQALRATVAELLPASLLNVADEVVEGVVDWQGRLRGLGETVEVGQHLGSAIAQLKIKLAAGTELEQVQLYSPPGQETAVVGASVLDARIGKAVEPAVEVRKKVTDGLHQRAAGDHGRPALSFQKRTRARSSATVS